VKRHSTVNHRPSFDAESDPGFNQIIEAVRGNRRVDGGPIFIEPPAFEGSEITGIPARVKNGGRPEFFRRKSG